MELPVAPGQTVIRRLEGLPYKNGKRVGVEMIPVTVKIWIDGRKPDRKMPPERPSAGQGSNPQPPPGGANSPSVSPNSSGGKSVDSASRTGPGGGPHQSEFHSSFYCSLGPTHQEAKLENGTLTVDWQFENAEAFAPRRYVARIDRIHVVDVGPDGYSSPDGARGWKYYRVRIAGDLQMITRGNTENITTPKITVAGFNTQAEAESFAGAISAAQK